MSIWNTIAEMYKTYFMDWSLLGLAFTFLQILLILLLIKGVTSLYVFIMVHYDSWYTTRYLNHIYKGFYIAVDKYIDSHIEMTHQYDSRYRYIYTKLNFSDELKEYLFVRMSSRAADMMTQIMRAYCESKFLTARGYIRHYQDQIMAAMYSIVAIEIDILNIDKLIENKLLDIPEQYQQDKS